ncbi:MAG TPA: LuxR family transcriptional regulator [Gammaproteobacteria bacterium]|nr:LuxR family transcriptional regulator [Gammaproteobacteria bacterium]
MSNRLVQTLIETSLQVDSVEKLHTLCASMCEHFGFDHFIYGARLPSSLVRPFVLVVSGYPDAWRSHYAARRYLTVDPTVLHCEYNTRPLIWEDLLRDPRTDPKAIDFMREARDFGLASGTSLPVRGSRGEAGMLSFSSEFDPDKARDNIQHALPEVFLLSAYVHEAACRLASEGTLPFKPRDLTPRERECLLWAAEGKTSWETAQILGISERTVIFHLRNVTEKLNVSSRQQAIARAISQGLIIPQLD